MSVGEARKLLGANADNYSDEELERIIAFYSAIATTVIDQATKKKG